MSQVGSFEGPAIKPASMPTCPPKHVPYAGSKRLFDLIMATLSLIILLPVFLIIALLVKLTSRGPVFYIGERVGLGGKRIKFIKFRTMVIDADEKLKDLQVHNEKDGPIFKMKNDPRIGAILTEI